jgi:hypothetical protein
MCKVQLSVQRSSGLSEQDQSKQRILEILNLEDLSPICAFAIERSGGVFSVGRQCARTGCGCSILKTWILTMHILTN